MCARPASSSRSRLPHTAGHHPGDRYQWLCAPVRRPEANPLRPVALAFMLVAAAELLDRVDHYGEQYPNPEAAGAEALERVTADER